ncbi:LytTR family transcriptional regulator [Oceanobacillus piezotolerans]|uniref:LytTR family transcriptional regulator n=1 Tax=Oceanobacillus piezotolerans TaxID=2448030 RepID=A0A498DDT8_9BACI|nr:LytTR family DNA-binding domain-containing protein [Oceanobacillus piezotolerans]RLL48372.1 LytTR family transcriptional regulator [Oceanobacillus piezotolerans]
MKLSLNIDKALKETRITIDAPELDDSIQEIIDFINGREQQFLIGKNGEMQHILKPDDIQYFHTEKNHVIAVTETDSFILKEKLYELEDKLPSKKFIRFSKSVIANLHHLNRFEPSFNGTLCVYFKSGRKEYVSRNYVPGIKKALKLNRRKVE